MIAQRGLDEQIVRDISASKNEPAWMLTRRLEGLRRFQSASLPSWGPDLSDLDFSQIKYFVRSVDHQAATWLEVPEHIKTTYDRLGIPAAEQQRLVSGVIAHYESEAVYHAIRADLTEQGVIFLDTDAALREHEELFAESFGRLVEPDLNPFAALNTAVWSGGSFVYVPPGVAVDIPLQAYYRSNTENMGQFERTLMIVDEGASVHYIEGCTAPVYSTASLHASVTEIVVRRGARCRCTTMQNWSNNVVNMVTKRAICHENATIEWVDGNLGAKVTMKYPTTILAGRGARAEVFTIAMAATGQHQDAGPQVVHAAPHTSSAVIARSIVRGSGRSSYRGRVRVAEGASETISTVKCDALLLGGASRADTYPHADVRAEEVSLGHEASASRVGEEQLFYLMSRGIPEEQALSMIVRGFIEPVARQLPMEYALELNRLIDMGMDGAVG
ncbi:MAG: Fe-S cluster assembly protein SufB [Micromonosporaceae bacterium]|nr:Fe-S cluster assembly protein SufB [Micromonosporaceae bacterium]